MWFYYDHHYFPCGSHSETFFAYVNVQHLEKWDRVQVFSHVTSHQALKFRGQDSKPDWQYLMPAPNCDLRNEYEPGLAYLKSKTNTVSGVWFTLSMHGNGQRVDRTVYPFQHSAVGKSYHRVNVPVSDMVFETVNSGTGSEDIPLDDPRVLLYKVGQCVRMSENGQVARRYVQLLVVLKDSPFYNLIEYFFSDSDIRAYYGFEGPLDKSYNSFLRLVRHGQDACSWWTPANPAGWAGDLLSVQLMFHGQVQITKDAVWDTVVKGW